MCRVETGGRSLFFTGDTGWHDALPSFVGDVDLMISEATEFEEAFEFHLSIERLKKERQKFECRRMILTHLGSEVLANLEQVDFDLAADGLTVKL